MELLMQILLWPKENTLNKAGDSTNGTLSWGEEAAEHNYSMYSIHSGREQEKRNKFTEAQNIHVFQNTIEKYLNILAIELF